MQSKLTAKEILSKIESKLSISEFAYLDYEPSELELGEIKVVDKYGGPDKGSTWYVVHYFVDHDVYIRTDGWYSSYDGVYFDEGYGSEVKPIDRVVTFYE